MVVNIGISMSMNTGMSTCIVMSLSVGMTTCLGVSQRLMHDTCAVPAIILQTKIQTNVERFTLTAKLDAISENLRSLLSACVQNEVAGIHKFYRREN